MRRVAAATFVLVAALFQGATAFAQTPQAQHLVQAGNLVYLGKFSLPPDDGTAPGVTANALTYGGSALGLGPDGQSLYFGCHDQGTRLARVTIPGIGGLGRVVEGCASVPNLSAINPGDANGFKLGGSLSWNGRLVVTGYAYYDANRTASSSHFVGSSVSALTGPYRVGNDPAATVGGYMGVVPVEWRGLLGGPALTGQCCISIISRTSYGPSVSVFDPDLLGNAATVPSQMLVGYPDAHQTLGGYYQSGPYFNAATQVGGVAFPGGTRSVLFIGSHGTTHCYGSGTTDPTLHNQPDGNGGIWCYDPTNMYKGPHGYPYRYQVWAYDANDLLAVKQGLKQPWDVMPYGAWTLPDIDGGAGTASLRSATYDPATSRWYVTTATTGGGTPEVHVYQITSAVLQATRYGPQNFAVNKAGGAWTFTWNPPTDPGWTSYVLEGGTAPGLADIGAVALAPGTTSLTVSAPAVGAIFVRLRALYPDGNHARSSELLVTGIGGGGGGAATTPTPANVRATASGTNLVLTWQAATGGAVSDVMLDAGTAPGRSDLVTGLSIGTSGTFVAPNVPGGHYYLRLRANGASGISATSNEAQVFIGTVTADVPGSPDAFRATATAAHVVTLTWLPPEDGGAPTGYLLDVGSRAGVSDIVVGIPVPAGQSYAVPGVPSGVYFLRLRAVNGAGAGLQSGEVRLVVP